jgi:hypothetical protein
MQKQPAFDLTFSNIPSINLRLEFDRAHEFVNSPVAERGLKPPIAPIEAAVMTWHGMPEDLFTLLLQRSILGLESYLSSALWHTSAVLGIATPGLTAKLRNPSAFGAKLFVANIYDRMPAAVHPELSLRYQDQGLYQKTVAFYREVRNPIFHGKQLSSPKIEAVRDAFAHLSDVFGWIDHWHPPDIVNTGPLVVGPLVLNLPKFKNRAP